MCHVYAGKYCGWAFLVSGKSVLCLEDYFVFVFVNPEVHNDSVVSVDMKQNSQIIFVSVKSIKL